MKSFIKYFTIFILGLMAGHLGSIYFYPRIVNVENYKNHDQVSEDIGRLLNKDVASSRDFRAAMLGGQVASIEFSSLLGKINPAYAEYMDRIGAENGAAVSQYNYGIRLLEEDNEYSKLRAVFWLKKAASNGDKDALLILEKLKK